MPFHYLENVATADAAFEASGQTREEMFVSAAEATLGVMVDHPDAIPSDSLVSFTIRQEDLEMLLFEFLQELIYRKDASGVLLRVKSVRINSWSGGVALEADAWFAPLRTLQGHLLTDVKAVTLYRFGVQNSEGKWKATVVLDV